MEISGRFGEPPPLSVYFDGRAFSARPGESLATALWAHGARILARSGKYHRPRGLFCGRGACGNCVTRIEGVPNERACLRQVGEGLRAESQHTLGSARFDWLGFIDRIFSRGLDHHHLLTGFGPLNRLAVAMARRMGGVGKLPNPILHAAGPPLVHRVDVAVVGAGEAGLAAAEVARAAGLETLVLDARALGKDIVTAQVLGLYDDRELLATAAGAQVCVQAKRYVVATGAHEQPPPCAGNDRPGILASRAARELLAAGVLPGEAVCLVVAPGADASTQKRAQALERELTELGVLVAAVGTPEAPGELGGVEGATRVQKVRRKGSARAIECDALIWCARPAPAHELASQMGVDAMFDPQVGGFLLAHDGAGRTRRPQVYVAGEVAGVEADQAADHGRRVGEALVKDAQLNGGGA